MPKFGHQFMSRPVETHHRGVAIFYVKLDGSAVAGGAATTNGLDAGAAQHMTVTENGDGDYTFTLNKPGQRFVSLQACSISDDALCTAAQVVDGTSCRVKQTTASTGAALADADFYLEIHCQYVADLT